MREKLSLPTYLMTGNKSHFILRNHLYKFYDIFTTYTVSGGRRWTVNIIISVLLSRYCFLRNIVILEKAVMHRANVWPARHSRCDQPVTAWVKQKYEVLLFITIESLCHCNRKFVLLQLKFLIRLPYNVCYPPSQKTRRLFPGGSMWDEMKNAFISV